MKIFFKNVSLRIQKQNVPTIQQTKVQTFLHTQDNDYRFVYMNKNGDVYPKKTENCCWWCRNQFSSDDFGIPVEKQEENDETYIEMEGHFCSFECCLSFLEDYSNSNNIFCYRKSKKILLELYKKLGNKGELRKAPDWKLLEKVGSGNLTIEQFRSGLAQFHRLPNIIPLSHTTKYMITKNKK